MFEVTILLGVCPGSCCLTGVLSVSGPAKKKTISNILIRAKLYVSFSLSLKARALKASCLSCKFRKNFFLKSEKDHFLLQALVNVWNKIGQLKNAIENDSISTLTPQNMVEAFRQGLIVIYYFIRFWAVRTIPVSYNDIEYILLTLWTPLSLLCHVYHLFFTYLLVFFNVTRKLVQIKNI